MTENNMPFSFWAKRGLARFTDYLIWGIISSFIILASSMCNAFQNIDPIYCVYAALFVAFLIYPVVEAACVARFGTTVGGKLTGISILTKNGEKLSFKASLKRAYLVYAVGLGCFLPVLSLLCLLVTVVLAIKGKEFLWDAKSSANVQSEKSSLFAKIILTLFYILLFAGVGFAAKNTYNLFNQSNVENVIFMQYWEDSRPIMEEIISEEAFASPENVKKTAENLKKLQQLILKYHQDYDDLYLEQLQSIKDIPSPEEKVRVFHEIDARSEALRMHWFAQSLRLSMLENIVAFFDEANGKYHFENGQPVFDDPDLMQAYQNFILQISGASPASENTAAQDKAETLPSLEITDEGAKEIKPETK
ncbi:rDD domain containing protein [Acetobacter sp. CAG:977]|mgnify:CR=1 FL=1|nr:rDD domain containing protein [Acetobacter sp. CAG:977]